MNTKFTKGPWSINDGSNHKYLKGKITCNDEIDGLETVIVDGPNGYYGEDVRKANAHLIAAAPELYEALDKLANGYVGNAWDVGLQPRLKKARAALSKARGES